MFDNFKSQQYNLRAVKPMLAPISTAVHYAVQAAINKLNLVTREEYEVQTQVLLKTRQRVEQLEKKLMELLVE